MAGDLFTEHSHPPRNEKRRRIKKKGKQRIEDGGTKIQKWVGWYHGWEMHGVRCNKRGKRNDEKESMKDGKGEEKNTTKKRGGGEIRTFF